MPRVVKVIVFISLIFLNWVVFCRAKLNAQLLIELDLLFNSWALHMRRSHEIWWQLQQIFCLYFELQPSFPIYVFASTKWRCANNSLMSQHVKLARFIIPKTKVSVMPCVFPELSLSSFSLSAWVHLCPRRPGWCSDGEHLLGALLSGARHPARRPDAQPQACGRPRWLVHHLLQWDWGWEVCPQSHICWPGTHCHRSVVSWYIYKSGMSKFR